MQRRTIKGYLYELLDRSDWAPDDKSVPAVLKKATTELRGERFKVALVRFGAAGPKQMALVLFPADRANPSKKQMADLIHTWMRLGWVTQLVCLENSDGDIAYATWQGDLLQAEAA